MSQFGDCSPVTPASIVEFLDADPELANQTEFAQRLTACGEAIDRALAAIPPGPGKARLGAREAFLFDPSLPLAALLARHPEGAVLADLAAACDPAKARHPERLLAAMFTLDLTEPRSAQFAAAVSDFRDSAMAAAAHVDGTDPRYNGLPISGDTHWLLHLAPRRSQLVFPLFAPMRTLVNGLVPFQSPSGYWALGSEEPDPLVFYSAGIAHNLAVFGDRRTPAIDEALTRALAWLEGVQRPEGGWPIRMRDAASDVITTAFTGDLLRRAGHQRGYERAVAFLIAQQHSAGLWLANRGDADAHSAIVLEVIEARLPPFPAFQHFLSLARDLFVKADELARTADEVSDQIALITAHQAVEMLLYAALEALEQPGNIWDGGGQRTIGLRGALTLLEQRLSEDGGGALSRKSQMQMLASARDTIVHKGHPVARSAVRSHLDDAQKFLSAASQRTLGYDLLG